MGINMIVHNIPIPNAFIKQHLVNYTFNRLKINELH